MSIFLNGVEYGGPQPLATADTVGVSKPDDSTIKVDANGTYSVNAINASQVNYDNTTSKIEPQQVQLAIDLLVSQITDLQTRLATAESGITAVEGRLTTAEGKITTIESALDRVLVVEEDN